jgi:putative membrane protein
MININDQKMIEDTVAHVEKITSGEVKVVMVDQSDRYPAAYLRCGILFALLSVFLPLPLTHAHSLLYFQTPLFFLGVAICFIPAIKSFFISKRESSDEVAQRAQQAFFENNLHNTKDRTAILIFVSLMERQVEILADTGINERVEKDAWDKIMMTLIGNIKKKNLTHGIMEAVSECGKILATHFPPNGSNPNEISNRPAISKK